MLQIKNFKISYNKIKKIYRNIRQNEFIDEKFYNNKKRNYLIILLDMNRGVRQDKKSDQKLARSRSKSPNGLKVNIKQNGKIQKSGSKVNNVKNSKSNNHLERSRSKSPQRSNDGKKGKNVNSNKLNKSKSQKKLNKSLSQSKVDVKKKINNISKVQKTPKNNSIAKNNDSMLMKSARSKVKEEPLKKKQETPKGKQKVQHHKEVQNNIKTQQKQMGLIFAKPQNDKVIFKNLQVTDEVFQKYHDMISNDNDSSYVTNALPQLISMKKQDDSAGRDFVSGKIARLSGVFDNLTVDKIITACKKVPQYYNGQCGKNLLSLKIILQTKFKVEVDLGFLLYSVDGDKLTIFRIYVSKIYRKMNYLGYIYLEIFKFLMSKHSGCDRWSIFILERNVNVHKFFKYLGFKIQKIATQSKNKTVDYFQQFTIKRKQLNTVIASMK